VSGRVQIQAVNEKVRKKSLVRARVGPQPCPLKGGQGARESGQAFRVVKVALRGKFFRQLHLKCPLVVEIQSRGAFQAFMGYPMTYSKETEVFFIQRDLFMRATQPIIFTHKYISKYNFSF